jgi:hypothetical protein
MSSLKISPLKISTVFVIYSEREYIELDPEYQRNSGIWTTESKQLLIDSIINEYDIPKIYFHEFPEPKRDGSKLYKYAIIDGKQRLQAIWDFIDGVFPLADNFRYLPDPEVKAEGLSYNDLSMKYPRLKIRFDGIPLPIIAIQTDDLELIEDMFSRLNEAEPLNAAEKRNAFPGPMPGAIREVAKHAFFTIKIPFSNKRYQHYDVVAKFLFLEHHNKITDTKKPYLDQFVRSFQGKPDTTVEPLMKKVEQILDRMAPIFLSKDKLLASVGMVVTYYLAFRNSSIANGDIPVTRQALFAFNEQRKLNREKAEQDIAKANYFLLTFDRHSQSPNDPTALEFRTTVLLNYLKQYGTGHELENLGEGLSIEAPTES